MKAKNETKEKNKREWVKNATIVFLAVMLVLTFFSNTIMNYSLPQVATEYVQSDSITAKIRGTGTITASDPYEVKATETRKVTSVKVKVGDEVQKDDVLLELEDKESDELIQARDNVESLELAFNQAIISNNISVAELDKIKTGKTTSITEMQNQLTAAQGKIDTCNKNIETYKANVASLETQLAMLGFVDTSAEATAVTNAKTAVTNADAQVATTQASSSSAQTALTNAQTAYTAIETAKKNYESAKTATATAQAAYDRACANANANSLPAGMTQAQADEAKAVASAELEAAQTEEATAKAVYDSLGDYNTLLNNYNSAQNAYNTASTAYSNAVSAQAAANNTLSAAQDTLSKKEDTSEQEKSINRQLATANATLATEQSSLATATTEFTELQGKFTNELTMTNQYNGIVEAKEKVAELEENAIGGSVKAPVSGKVSNVSIVAGESMSPDTTIVTIQPAGKEKTLTISVTNEQARKVSVGAVGEVSNAWYYNDVTLTLTQIKADPDSKGAKKLLVFSVEGDVTDGQSLDISVGDRSTTYDLVVPNSAVREDKDGKYILVVESKSSPLGNRYIATKVNVEVLASDDKQTAVKGDVESYSYVITTASKPISAGDQVRFYE